MEVASPINAVKTCTFLSFINWRVRNLVTRRVDLGDLANAYVRGAVTYAARASVLGQDIFGRAILGQINKLAYSQLKFVGAPAIIESLEPVVVSLIEKAGFRSIMSNARLGMETGLLCIFYGGIVKMMECDQTIGTNTTQYHNESLSMPGHEGQPLASQEMELLG